jgi:hypothetical protein
MAQLTPLAAVQLFTVLGSIEWTAMDRRDLEAFADAGDGAMMAELTQEQSAKVADAFAAPLSATNSLLMAVIGGDALQVEFHGLDADEAPLALSLPLDQADRII